MPSSKDFLLGADPEFGIMRGGQMVYPQSNEDDEFGADGCGRVAEIRPPPDVEPTQVVKNIHEILQHDGSISSIAHSTKWKAGSMAGDEPIGGHIHFGILDKGIKSYDVAANTLDLYLTVPVRLIEDLDEAEERCRRDYGCLTDIREQPWGMEYRTLGSWLVSPQIALGVLSLAKVVMYEIVNKKLRLGPSSDTLDALKSFDKKGLKDAYDRIMPDLSKFTLYSEYVANIEAIHSLIREEKTHLQKWPEMKKAWGLKFKNIKKESLTNIWSPAQ